MNEAEIRQMWEYAAQAWPNYPIPPKVEQRAVRVQAWADSFGDLTAGAVRAALVALEGRDFFPPLGVVRAKAVELAKRAQGWRPAPDADRAWAEVVESFRYRYDWDRKPAWSHPVVEQTVQNMGWSTLADSEHPDTTRAHFIRFYEMAANRHGHMDEPDPPGVVVYLDAHRPPAALATGE